MRKLHIEGLQKSTMTNLYMLEQQMMILKKNSVRRINNERADHLPLDNG
jgi:hypothetical protein